MRPGLFRTRQRGMTRRQADLVIKSAYAVGFESAASEEHSRDSYHVVLHGWPGAGTARITAWTWDDWLTICKEVAEHELPF